MNTIHKIYLSVIASLIIVAVYWHYKSVHELVAVKTADSLLISKEKKIDELGRQIVKLTLAKGTLEDVLHGKDSIIKKLVNKNTIAAVNIRMVTRDSLVFVPDTVIASGNCDTFEVRKSWCNEWSEGRIIARKDSIYTRFTVFNDLSLQIENKHRWLRPDVAEIRIVNGNPHTRTINEAAFVHKSPPKRNLWWFSGGILVGIVAFSLIP